MEPSMPNDKTDKIEPTDTTDTIEPTDKTDKIDQTDLTDRTVMTDRTVVTDRVDRVNKPARPKGPNASAIVFGLVAMALAGLLISLETTDLRIDWSRLGPGAIIGTGVVMAVIGAIGLIRRHDDVQD
jgi:hypothetical protein